MQSHEAVKAAVDDKGPKEVASAMNVSLSLVYKWCEGKTGNPLDRVAELVDATGSTVPLSWLCTRAQGSFLPRPPPVPADDARLVDDTRRMLKEFSDVLSAMTAAFLDGHVSDAEAKLIRREWEELLPIAEGLVRACEARAEADRARAPR
ncbi:MAG TPA: phage regulatory CII family protein [Myxococcota bacterium]